MDAENRVQILGQAIYITSRIDTFTVLYSSV